MFVFNSDVANVLCVVFTEDLVLGRVVVPIFEDSFILYSDLAAVTFALFGEGLVVGGARVVGILLILLLWSRIQEFYKSDADGYRCFDLCVSVSVTASC